MGGGPIGLDWLSMQPLIDLLAPDDRVEKLEVIDALSVMESEALETMRKFAPKDTNG